MDEINKNLTPKQQKGIIALLGSKTVANAANEAGVSRTTVYEWMRQPGFSAELRKAQSVAIDAASTRLANGLSKAVDVLYEVMTGKETSEGVKRLAASDWINYSLRLREFAVFEARLEALERGE